MPSAGLMAKPAAPHCQSMLSYTQPLKVAKPILRSETAEAVRRASWRRDTWRKKQTFQGSCDVPNVETLGSLERPRGCLDACPRGSLGLSFHPKACMTKAPKPSVFLRPGTLSRETRPSFVRLQPCRHRHTQSLQCRSRCFGILRAPARSPGTKAAAVLPHSAQHRHLVMSRPFVSWTLCNLTIRAFMSTRHADFQTFSPQLGNICSTP